MRLLVVGFLFFQVFQLLGQERRAIIGLFPEYAISYKLNDNWKLIQKTESQHGVFRRDESLEIDEVNYFHYRTDLQFFASYKLNPLAKIDGGYQFRFENGNSHRTIQQYAWINYWKNFRLGHRLRADQTFEESEAVLWRIRYRLGTDFALQGASIDPGEKYLTGSFETILGYAQPAFQLENRYVFGVGHYFNNKHKFEMTLDYRTDAHFEPRFRQRAWVKLSYFWSIN
jgi:hypothetical protein